MQLRSSGPWIRKNRIVLCTNYSVSYTHLDVYKRQDFVIYNIPQLAGVALTPSLYKEMLKNPRVIGVKNSSMPVQDIQTFASLGGDDHIVFNGPDEKFLGGRLMGAHAGIGGTYGAMPELFLKLNQLIAEKDLETARALQFAINDIIGVLTDVYKRQRPSKGLLYSLVRFGKSAGGCISSIGGLGQGTSDGL